MKKLSKMTIALMLVAAIVMSFAACAKKGDSAQGSAVSGDILSAQTLGDIISNDGVEEQQTSYSGTKYVYVFTLDGKNYRAIADCDEATGNAIFDIDYSDSDYEQQIADLISPLAVETCELLDDYILPQEELDQLVGKTGEDLLNDGWRIGMSYNTADLEFELEKDCWAYTVTFDGDPMENTDDFDAEEAIKTLTVKSVTFADYLGDATNIDVEE
ncbi:MAG: hypothetical protein IJ168_07765 [Eubacterium sp.]|nr:hypothetical protein [Eubacterium sp.]